MDKLWSIGLGFLLYTLSTIVAATIVAPYFSGLVAWFGVFGVYAAYVFGSVISFPVLILFFAAFNYLGFYGEIPEVSSIFFFIPWNLNIATFIVSLAAGTAYLLILRRHRLATAPIRQIK